MAQVLLVTAFLSLETFTRIDANLGVIHENTRTKLQTFFSLFDMTDLKFKWRGAKSPKNKIVIVEIDSPSLEVYGGWPWHRDITGRLIEKIFAYQPKAVGVDMVFPGLDVRVPKNLREELTRRKLSFSDTFETDGRAFQRSI